jgi:hypothetical protein
VAEEELDGELKSSVGSPGFRSNLPIIPFSRNFGNKACAGSLVGPQLIFRRLLDVIGIPGAMEQKTRLSFAMR